MRGRAVSGAQVSAQTVQRVSASGSLFDETGYNTLTNESLWPWPNEARIKADMSAVLDESGITIGARGFGHTNNLTSFTDYICSYLGTTHYEGLITHCEMTPRWVAIQL